MVPCTREERQTLGYCWDWNPWHKNGVGGDLSRNLDNLTCKVCILTFGVKKAKNCVRTRAQTFPVMLQSSHKHGHTHTLCSFTPRTLSSRMHNSELGPSLSHSLSHFFLAVGHYYDTRLFSLTLRLSSSSQCITITCTHHITRTVTLLHIHTHSHTLSHTCAHQLFLCWTQKGNFNFSVV